MAGTLVIDTLTDGSGNTTSATAAIRGSAKAWVNFNGAGAAVIRASYNVSSVTYNATGDYTVNFTNALASANYAWSSTTSESAGPYPSFLVLKNGYTPTTTGIRLQSRFGTGWGATDAPYGSFVAYL